MNKKEKGKPSSRGKGRQSKTKEREEARYGSRKIPHSTPSQASDSKGKPRHQRAAPQAAPPSRYNQGLGYDPSFQHIHSQPSYSPALLERNSAVQVPSSSLNLAGGHPAYSAAVPQEGSSGTYSHQYPSDSGTHYGSNTSSWYAGYPGTTAVQSYAAVPAFQATNRTTPHIQTYPENRFQGLGTGLNTTAYGSGGAQQGSAQYGTPRGYYHRRQQGEPVTGRSQAIDPGPPIGHGNKGPFGANLFVFHIPNDMTNEDLAYLFRPGFLFRPGGNLLSARIMTEHDTGKGRGFGFVSYDSVNSAVLAIHSLDGLEVSPIWALQLLLILLLCSTPFISLLARLETKS